MTKYTSDRSQRERLSAQFNESNCFKDLVNSEFGSLSLLQKAKSSQKFIETSLQKFSKTSFEELK